ncbi:Glycosyltransferase involved in cell wall bisynthesis [Devosia enhydra]|uniref:Glycosyltransferase involved in cell wall bisynthesis n=1 Tax=Devosia enhydra TaxID=665118 RepID=A0A1K2HSP6_9HYPH|nr:glycosyltransferase [Devosia enhydra]SFZ81050.1 Glycosyltransferase involved in cell wall bisynthesis [Devosia enhydra]
MTPAPSRPNPLRTLGVVLEERFRRKPDGSIWSTGNFGDAFWQRYLEVFDAVVVIARIEPWDGTTPVGAVTRDPRVRFAAVSPYLGIGGFVRRLPSVLASVGRGIEEVDCLALRLPGTLGMVAGLLRARLPKPYFVELVGDPDSVFGAGVGGRMAPLLRRIFVPGTQLLVRQASGAAYVTERVLQRQYPASPGRPVSAYSSIVLSKDWFSAPAGPVESPMLRLLSVGSLETRYKGMDVLVSAVGRLVAEGRPVRLTIIGGGAFLAPLRDQVAALGLCDHVDCLGHQDRQQVMMAMRACDLYIQPSRTEGLARTVIEAMATGRPVIATRVGGLVELVPDEWLVPSDDPEALADAIVRAWPAEIRAAMSAASVTRAQDFLPDTLAGRRRAFYHAFVEAARHDA